MIEVKRRMHLVAFTIMALAIELQLQFYTGVAGTIQLDVKARPPPVECDNKHFYCGKGKACKLSRETGICVDIPSESTLKSPMNTYCSPSLNLCGEHQSCFIVTEGYVDGMSEEESHQLPSNGFCLNCDASDSKTCRSNRDCCYGYNCFAFVCINDGSLGKIV